MATDINPARRVIFRLLESQQLRQRGHYVFSRPDRSGDAIIALLAEKTGCMIGPRAEVGPFSEKVKALSLAEGVFSAFRNDIFPHYSGESLIPFVKVVMKRARRFVTEQKDVDSALAVWKNMRKLIELPGDKPVVFYSILALARQMTDPVEPQQGKDIDCALALWRTAGDFDGRTKARKKIINSMVGAADNLCVVAKDYAGAIKIWQTAFPLCLFQYQRESLIANMHLNAAQAAQDDFPLAEKIWLAIFELDPKHKKKNCIEVQQLANRFVDSGLKAADRKPELAIKIWNFLYRVYPDPERLILIRHMRDIARAVSDLESPRVLWDFDCAIKIWRAVYDFNYSAEQNKRVLGTMRHVADKLEDINQPLEKIDRYFARVLRETINELTAQAKP